MKKRLIFYITFLLLTVITMQAQQKQVLNAQPLHRAQNALTRTIVHDIFAPPVASRIYLYANMAAYEAACPARKIHQFIGFHTFIPRN